MLEGLRAAGLPETAITRVPVTDREAVGMMLEGLGGAIDLIIPRGGKGLTGRVMAEARVPVLAHLEGVCHVYIHAAADPAKARAIAVNAKMRRTSVCGAAETLLIDRAILPTLGVTVLNDLAKAGCEIRADAAVRAAFPDAKAANDDDWSTEYLDAVIAAKAVDGVEDAIAHIERYGSHHTESIVTEDRRGGGAVPFRASIRPSSCGMPRRNSPTARSSGWGGRSVSARENCTHADPSAWSN